MPSIAATPPTRPTGEPSAPISALPALRFDLHGRLDVDLSCRSCGYNLRGLDPHGVCPECQTPVMRSVRGDLLAFCDPAWVRRLAVGMVWVICGVIGGVILGIAVGIILASMLATGTLTTPQFVVVATLGGMLGSVVQGVGYWLLTSPDPGSATDSKAQRLRRMARAAILSALILSPLAQSSQATTGIQPAGPGALATGPVGIALSIVALGAGVLGLIGYTAFALYLYSLALRIPALNLAMQTRIVMWGLIVVLSIGLVTQVAMMSMGPAAWTAPPGAAGPAMPPAFWIMVAGGCLVGLGSLVFGIWSLVLMFIYRARFANAEAQARYHWERIA